MTRTQKYDLPQWEGTDPIRRADFNTAMEKIEEGISTCYVVGTYTGNGAELADGGLFIELGFRPRFVIVSKGCPEYNRYVATTLMLTETPADGAERYFTLDDTGFTVGLCSTASSAMQINKADTGYSFVAFR